MKQSALQNQILQEFDTLNTLRKAEFYISDIQLNNSRKPFTFKDMISNVGGLIKALVLIGGIFLSPVYFKLQELTFFNHSINIKLSKWFKWQWLCKSKFKCGVSKELRKKI